MWALIWKDKWRLFAKLLSLVLWVLFCPLDRGVAANLWQVWRGGGRETWRQNSPPEICRNPRLRPDLEGEVLIQAHKQSRARVFVSVPPRHYKGQTPVLPDPACLPSSPTPGDGETGLADYYFYLTNISLMKRGREKNYARPALLIRPFITCGS